MGRILVGADPEFSVLAPGGYPVPAHKVGFEDKQNKRVFTSGKAFRDGYNIEINVEPSHARLVMIARVRKTLLEILDMLPPGHKLLTLPSIKIDLGFDMYNAPDDVLAFGCEPSAIA